MDDDRGTDDPAGSAAEDTTTDGSDVNAADGSLEERVERELRVKNRAMDDTEIGITISAMTDEGPQLQFVNEGFERITGYSADVILAEGWEILAGEGSDRENGTAVMEAVQNGQGITEQLISYRRDGTPFWHRVRITPIEDDDGRLTHMAGFHEDITESKREAVLFGVLNRVLRHNLRNEMTILQGHAERIEDDSEERPAVADDVRELAADLTAVSNAARELDSYARSRRTVERIAVGELVEGVLDHYAPSSATVTVDVSTDRAICAGPEIERALGELVENAVVHDDAPTTAVTVEVAPDGGDVVVTVTDDGPGIPPNESTVFEEGRETALEHSGGLGLWLVNWIVTRYGGSFQIEARSCENGDDGTVATVRLPGIGPDEDVAEAARRATPLFQ